MKNHPFSLFDEKFLHTKNKTIEIKWYPVDIFHEQDVAMLEWCQNKGYQYIGEHTDSPDFCLLSFRTGAESWRYGFRDPNVAIQVKLMFGGAV